ncbi:MAG: ThuA domain-containing protein [Mycobacteriales bacterium]
MNRLRPLALVAAVLATFMLVPVTSAGPVPPARANLLLFNFSLGFHHLSIPHRTEVLTQALAREGYRVTVSGDPKDLTPSRLADTDAVVWLNTTGAGAAPFSPAVKRSFEDWMRCGGGNVGIHAMAGPLFTGWPAWTKIWGTTEGGEPLTETSVADDDTARYEGWGQFDVTVKVDDHRSPATAPWHGVTTFNARDEWYHWASDPSKVVPDSHQLLGFDGFTDPRTATQFAGSGYWFDMPIAYTGSFAHTNRDFYTNLGHSTTMFDSPEYVAHVLGGTDWVTKVRPSAGCLAAHGMRGQTARREAAPSRPGAVQVLQPPAAPVSQAACWLTGPARFTGSKASLYGGLGLCNGQLDVACSLGAAGPPQLPGGGCSDPAHATAGVEAGETYVDPRTDRRYQEPPLTSSGPCAAGMLAGVLFVTWRDHRLSILSVMTTGGVLTGKVLDQITLKPVRGGRPLVVRSTEFAGGTVSGSLSLASCVTQGVVPQVPFFGTPGVGVVSGSLTVTA